MARISAPGLRRTGVVTSVRPPFGLDCPTCHLVTVDKMIVPSFEVVMRWLTQGQIPHYLCEQCHGIHIVDIQSLEGVLESRLFVESEGLMFTTELEIRPVGLLPLVAELGRLNMNYPTLKIFVDVVDDNLPRLMICDTIHIAAGLTDEQLQLFMTSAITGMKQLYGECEQAGYLNPPEESAGANAVH
jgi:hypothetical protein